MSWARLDRRLILRTPKRRYWLLWEPSVQRYRPIAPKVVATRLRELGLSDLSRGPKGALSPSQIAERSGAIVTSSVFAAAERAQPWITPEQKAEIDRLNQIADEASARGDHDAGADAGHRATLYVLSLVRRAKAKKA
jgi:hypothetical protein